MADTPKPPMTLEQRIRLAVELAEAGRSRKDIARRTQTDPKALANWFSVARALGRAVPRLAAAKAVGKEADIKRMFGEEKLMVKEIAYRLKMTVSAVGRRVNDMQRRGELPYRLPRKGRETQP